MNTRVVKLIKTTNVPNKNGATNFGGLASTGDTLYAVKSGQSDTVASIYKFSGYKATSPTVKSFSGLGHANGMTYYNGYLWIPKWKSATGGGDIARIKFSDKTKTTIKAPAGVNTSCIAHYKGNQFIIGRGTSEDKTERTFSLIEVSGTNYKVLFNFKTINPKPTTYNINQDIYFKDGILYVPEVNSSYTKNIVLLYDITNLEANKIFEATTCWSIDSPDGDKYEVETMTIDKSGHILFGLNSPKDGIYQYKR